MWGWGCRKAVRSRARPSFAEICLWGIRYESTNQRPLEILPDSISIPMGTDSCTQPLPGMKAVHLFPATSSQSWNAFFSSWTSPMRLPKRALQWRHLGSSNGLLQTKFFPIPCQLYLYHFPLLKQADSSDSEEPAPASGMRMHWTQGIRSELWGMHSITVNDTIV